MAFVGAFFRKGRGWLLEEGVVCWKGSEVRSGLEIYIKEASRSAGCVIGGDGVWRGEGGVPSKEAKFANQTGSPRFLPWQGGSCNPGRTYNVPDFYTDALWMSPLSNFNLTICMS